MPVSWIMSSSSAMQAYNRHSGSAFVALGAHCFVCVQMLRVASSIERRLHLHSNGQSRGRKGARVVTQRGQKRRFESRPDLGEDSPLSPVFLEYDPSPLHLIHTMLDAANLKQHETYLDFGSGDGRWIIEAAKTYGCKSIGIEIVPELVKASQKAIEKEKVAHLAEVWQVDGFNTDLSFTDVVSVYNTKEGMSVLVPKLQKELKAGSRVICIKLPIDGWIPDFQQRMYEFKVYVYSMPPKIKMNTKL